METGLGAWGDGHARGRRVDRLINTHTHPKNQPDPAADMGIGIWVNALRCLDAAGLPLPQTLAAAGCPYAWMLDSGYTSVDGTVLAKPGTALTPGQLLFCR